MNQIKARLQLSLLTQVRCHRFLIAYYLIRDMERKRPIRPGQGGESGVGFILPLQILVDEPKKL